MAIVGPLEYSEYREHLIEIKKIDYEICSSIERAIDELLKFEYPEEDIAIKIIHDLERTDVGLNGTDKKVLSRRNLIFKKKERISEKARRLRLEGIPREQIVPELNRLLVGSGISKIMIRKVCSVLGYTDQRYANRR